MTTVIMLIPGVLLQFFSHISCAVFVRIPVPFEHHPNACDSKSTNENFREIPVREQRATAEKQYNERQCAADEHHPHHVLVIIMAVVCIVVVMHGELC